MQKSFHVLKFACSLVALCALAQPPVVFADASYDAGLKAFQSRKYADAAAYFEKSIKAAPWESNSFYYCALSYHYMKDFKRAAEKYGDCVERFPGSPACNQALEALKVVDPGYLKRKATAVATAEAAAATKPKSGSAAASGQDKGTVEGQDQTRVLYRLSGTDKVVDLRINGRSTRAILDENAEDTTFSRQQLSSVSINPDKGASEFKCEIAVGGAVRKNFPISVSDSGQAAKIGNSFLDAYTVTVNESGKFIDLKRKAGGGAGAASVGFSRDGKDIMVSVEINGRASNMAFDPNSDGLSFNTRQAKSAGLKVDDADSVHQAPGEGPQRGEPGWVPLEDRAPGAKILAVRMKVGPVERVNVTCQVTDQFTAKNPKFGADFFAAAGYKYDIDYKTNKITLSRK